MPRAKHMQVRPPYSFTPVMIEHVEPVPGDENGLQLSLPSFPLLIPLPAYIVRHFFNWIHISQNDCPFSCLPPFAGEAGSGGREHVVMCTPRMRFRVFAREAMFSGLWHLTLRMRRSRRRAAAPVIHPVPACCRGGVQLNACCALGAGAARASPARRTRPPVPPPRTHTHNHPH